MSSVAKYVLGGSDSKQQQSSVSKPVDLTPQAFKDLQQPFAQTLGSVLSGQGRPAYTGDLVAPITGAEQTALGATAGAAYDPNRQSLIAQTLQGQFLPGQQNANPFLQAAIEAAQRPTMQGLEEVLSRTLPGRFTQAGGFIQPQGNSAFDRAAAIATRGAGQQAADIATNISSNAYNQERQLQQGAIGLGQQDVATLIANTQAQGLPRLIQDLGVERGLAEYQSRMQSFLQALQIAGGVTQPTIGQQTVSQGTGTSSSSTGLLPSLATAFGGGGGVKKGA